LAGVKEADGWGGFDQLFIGWREDGKYEVVDSCRGGDETGIKLVDESCFGSLGAGESLLGLDGVEAKNFGDEDCMFRR